MKTLGAECLPALLVRGRTVADGKSKTIWETGVPDVCLMAFKPHARSITARREGEVAGTDSWRLLATLDILLRLESRGIATHLCHPQAVEAGGRLQLAVCRARPIPIEWIVRYEAAGSIVRLFPSLVSPGQRFDRPVFKYDYKQDVQVAGVDDPTLNESYIVGLGLLGEAALREAQRLLAAVGEEVRGYLRAVGVRLIDMKMEFGFDPQGRMVVIDEISQDCIRAVDERTGASLTKDVYREHKSAAEVVAAYEAFARRLRSHPEELLWKT
jgi:phosphoribosylaminoimidazole-succinocarboxamide synthase